MNFCGFCGKKLETGECCNCEEAKATRIKQNLDAHITPPKFCEFCGAFLSDGECCNCDGARNKRASEPEKESSANKTSEIVKQGNAIAKETISELKDIGAAFAKDPVATVKGNELSWISGVVLFVIQVLTFGFMVFVSLNKILKPIIGMYSMFSTGPKVNILGMSFKSCLIIILNIVVFLACFYILTLIFNKKADIKRIVSTLAVSSAIWSAAYLVIGIIGIVLPANILLIVSAFVLFFTLACSVCIFNIRVSGEFESDYLRTLLVSLMYGAGSCIFILIMDLIMNSYFQQLFSMFSY